jgi:hypothetical protein
MTASELPGSLLQFIRSCVPTFVAAELLLFLHSHQDETWTSEDVSTISPTSITESAAGEYLLLFKTCGLVAQDEGGRYRYAPNSAELEENVRSLLQAYNERPVTLIRTIYTIADSKIQSLADAFKLRREP